MNYYIPKNESETGGSLYSEDRWESIATKESATETERLLLIADSYPKLSERTKQIDIDLIRARKDLNDFKKDTKKKIDYVLACSIIITLGFFIAAIPIFIEYFYFKEQMYEKFVDKIEIVKENCYTKSDIDSKFSIFYTKDQIDHQFSNLKLCLISDGWLNCFNK